MVIVLAAGARDERVRGAVLKPDRKIRQKFLAIAVCELTLIRRVLRRVILGSIWCRAPVAGRRTSWNLRSRPIVSRAESSTPCGVWSASRNPAS